jgi:hypothetical protein
MSDQEQTPDENVPEDADLEGDNPPSAPEGESVSGFPEPPGPGDPQPDPDAEPHHDLSNPVKDPDPTEYPDPYEDRADPRDPEASDPQTPRPPSTSEPHPPRNTDEEHHEHTSSKGAHKRDTGGRPRRD